MPLKAATGALFVATALATGCWEGMLMMRQVLGGPGSAWYPLMFGASILLLNGSISTVPQATKVAWLTALAIFVPSRSAFRSA
jgi:hypothetical protein